MTTSPTAHLAALSAAGLQRLQSFLNDGPCLLAFDFDGTLAPIVAHPESARTPLPVIRAMEPLLRTHEVAVLSGRSVEDLMTRLGFEAHHLIGNHGAEDPACPLSQQRAPAYRARLDGIRAAVASTWSAALCSTGWDASLAHCWRWSWLGPCFWSSNHRPHKPWALAARVIGPKGLSMRRALKVEDMQDL